jgi:hypothetical protein
MVPVKVGVGVGPPDVSGVVPGSPTGPSCCVVVAAVFIRVVVVVKVVDVPAGGGAEVCLGCRRDVSSGLVEVKKKMLTMFVL